MIADLQKMINPKAIVSVATKDRALTIKETAPDSKIDKLTINGLPANILSFTLDLQPKDDSAQLFKQLSCYLDPANGAGINKGCDLVLIDSDNRKVILIELKSDKPKVTETQIQLKNSELFVRYLFSMLHSFYGHDVDRFEYRHVVVTSRNNGLSKRAVSDKNRDMNTFGVNQTYKVLPLEVTARDKAKKSGVVHFGRF